MNSSQNRVTDMIYSLYRDPRTVFRLNDIAMLTDSADFQSLNKRVNYFVRTGKLLNPRKGIYTLPDYNPEELAGSIFRPSYISLEYVLQQSGIIFQYDPCITSVSYLARSIEVSGQTYKFRKIKGEIMAQTTGINRYEDHINKASPERAFLDLLYLNPTFYFDNLNPLNKQIISTLLPIYQSKALSDRVKQIMKNG